MNTHPPGPGVTKIQPCPSSRPISWYFVVPPFPPVIAHVYANAHVHAASWLLLCACASGEGRPRGTNYVSVGTLPPAAAAETPPLGAYPPLPPVKPPRPLLPPNPPRPLPRPRYPPRNPLSTLA